MITAIILGGTGGLLGDSFNLALDAVPAGIDPEAVKSYLSALILQEPISTMCIRVHALSS